MTLYREHFTDENELPRGREGWIFAGTDDEFGIRDRWMVPVEDERLTRAEWEATIDKEAGQRDLERQFDARPQIVDFSVAFGAAVKGET